MADRGKPDPKDRSVFRQRKALREKRAAKKARRAARAAEAACPWQSPSEQAVAVLKSARETLKDPNTRLSEIVSRQEARARPAPGTVDYGLLDDLLFIVDEQTGLLERESPHDQQPYLTGLRNLCLFNLVKCWIRPMKDWQPRSHNASKQFGSLARQDSEGTKVLLTIEVSIRHQAIVQARGFANRRPSSKERSLLRDWAKNAGLSIASYV